METDDFHLPPPLWRAGLEQKGFVLLLDVMAKPRSRQRAQTLPAVAAQCHRGPAPALRHPGPRLQGGWGGTAVEGTLAATTGRGASPGRGGTTTCRRVSALPRSLREHGQPLPGRPSAGEAGSRPHRAHGRSRTEAGCALYHHRDSRSPPKGLCRPAVPAWSRSPRLAPPPSPPGAATAAPPVLQHPSCSAAEHPAGPAAHRVARHAGRRSPRSATSRPPGASGTAANRRARGARGRPLQPMVRELSSPVLSERGVTSGGARGGRSGRGGAARRGAAGMELGAVLEAVAGRGGAEAVEQVLARYNEEVTGCWGGPASPRPRPPLPRRCRRAAPPRPRPYRRRRVAGVRLLRPGGAPAAAPRAPLLLPFSQLEPPGRPARYSLPASLRLRVYSGPQGAGAVSEGGESRVPGEHKVRGSVGRSFRLPGSAPRALSQVLAPLEVPGVERGRHPRWRCGKGCSTAWVCLRSLLTPVPRGKSWAQ